MGLKSVDLRGEVLQRCCFSPYRLFQKKANEPLGHRTREGKSHPKKDDVLFLGGGLPNETLLIAFTFRASKNRWGRGTPPRHEWMGLGRLQGLFELTAVKLRVGRQ